MSPITKYRQRFEVLFLLIVSILSFLWYSAPQFRESIYFSVRLIRFVIPNFPDIFP
jgi:uncharacterized protein YybS (DUF2232 family)